VRLYDHLMLEGAGLETVMDDEEVEGEETADLSGRLNPNSLQTLTGCFVEPSLAGAQPLARYQFERQGYFCLDPDSAPGRLVFSRTVGLRDKWARVQKAGGAEE
jgi:glutaminyl-tRNA synthetase